MGCGCLFFDVFLFGGVWCLVGACFVGLCLVGVCSGRLQKLQSYFCGVFCVEKLRNLDLCLFGIVTFVTNVTFWVCACSCCLSL